MQDPLQRAREAALRRLLDDGSPTVVEALLKELQRLGDRGQSWLRSMRASGTRAERLAAQRLLERLSGPDVTADFIRYIRSLRYDLESGALMLNRVVQPDLDVGGIQAQLDQMARRASELMAPPMSPWEQCKVLNRVLFHEYGFRGNQEDFEDPLNSYLGAVLRRRKGLPISLSIVYLLVAERCGIALEPVGVPHRFMVGCFREGTPFYVDVFAQGHLLSFHELEDLIGDLPESCLHELLGPTPVSEVLCRCCRNLQRHYAGRGEPAMAQQAARFVEEFEATQRRDAPR